MGLPQMIFVGFACAKLGFELCRHGTTTPKKHDVRITFGVVAVLSVLLLWGGFFRFG